MFKYYLIQSLRGHMLKPMCITLAFTTAFNGCYSPLYMVTEAIEIIRKEGLSIPVRALDTYVRLFGQNLRISQYEYFFT